MSASLVGGIVRPAFSPVGEFDVNSLMSTPPNNPQARDRVLVPIASIWRFPMALPQESEQSSPGEAQGCDVIGDGRFL
jgi:hypothetical protein